MKNAVRNVMIIIERISKGVNKTFQGAPGLLDARIAKMSFVPNTVHLKWPIFPTGLYQYVKSKSSKEKGLSGGSFGKIRSSWFPDILLQLHLAIDYDGKILPNSKTFKYTSRGINRKEVVVEVGNVTKIVQRAILALLDFFYSICRLEFKPEDIADIEKLSLHAYQQYQDLDLLRRQLLFFDEKENSMRKTHYLFHTGFWIRSLGALSQYNTESFEAAHRLFTTGNYARTSKRQTTMNTEMHNHSLRSRHLELVEFRSAMLSDKRRNKYLVTHGPKVLPPTLELSKVNNTKEIRLNRLGKNFKLSGNNLTPQHFHPHTGLENIASLIKDVICGNSDENWDNNILGVDGHGFLAVSIISGVTYKSPKENDVGSGHLYANHAYGSTTEKGKKRPRYDFILINYEEAEIPAQIISLIQVTDTSDKDDVAETFYAICLYLQESNKSKHLLDHLLAFEYHFVNINTTAE